jgi:acyl-coenzyme A thioesterase PaaI-like protein
MTQTSQSLQQTFAPSSICFGCGPANEKGLRIGSFPQEVDANGVEWIACRWTAESHHEAFPGMLNGGIIGALLDCHSNWTAAYTLMKAQGLAVPPCTVTADFHVTLKRPTPTGAECHLKARAIEVSGDRVKVEAILEANGKVTATCVGLFVAVKEGHPAYHRWG